MNEKTDLEALVRKRREAAVALRERVLAKPKLESREAHEYLLWFGGHERVDRQREIYDKLDVRTQLELIVSAWSMEPIPSRHYEFWNEVLPRRPYSDNPADFAELPDLLVIYRGGDKDSVWEGFSWTLSRKVAEDFSRLENIPIGSSARRERRRPGAVVEAQILKSDVSLYITERDEAEIVLRPEHWPDPG
jgi:hypothetical protein